MLSRISAKGWLLALLACCALFFLYFFGLTRTGMLGPDEPRYAAIGRAMAQTGDWITPRLWGEAWFEKPALLYWMTAAGFKLGLGPDLAPRLPVAIVSVLFLVYFFLVLRREFGLITASYGTAILGTSVGWLAYSHVAVTDLPLSAAFAASMFTIWRESPAETRNSGSAPLAGALLGLSILAKGLVPLALFPPALWYLRHRKRYLAVLFLSAFAIAAPWYILVTLRNGQPFLVEFFWKHHFERFATDALQHTRPFWFFIPVLVAGFFPWSPLLALLFRRGIYSDPRVAFLLAWFAWGFVFLSLSRNKLPGYLLPLVPAVAALMAVALVNAPQGSQAVMWSLGISAGLVWFVRPISNLLPETLGSGLSHASLYIGADWIVLALITALICAVLEKKHRRDCTMIFATILITLAVTDVIWRIYPRLDARVSVRTMWLARTESITCVAETNRARRYGLNYYSQRALPDCN